MFDLRALRGRWWDRTAVRDAHANPAKARRRGYAHWTRVGTRNQPMFWVPVTRTVAPPRQAMTREALDAVPRDQAEWWPAWRAYNAGQTATQCTAYVDVPVEQSEGYALRCVTPLAKGDMIGHDAIVWWNDGSQTIHPITGYWLERMVTEVIAEVTQYWGVPAPQSPTGRALMQGGVVRVAEQAMTRSTIMQAFEATASFTWALPSYAKALAWCKAQGIAPRSVAAQCRVMLGMLDLTPLGTRREEGQTYGAMRARRHALENAYRERGWMYPAVQSVSPGTLRYLASEPRVDRQQSQGSAQIAAWEVLAEARARDGVALLDRVGSAGVSPTRIARLVVLAAMTVAGEAVWEQRQARTLSYQQYRVTRRQCLAWGQTDRTAGATIIHDEDA
jgi:hypothetical protein